jgi:hypothetical protein
MLVHTGERSWLHDPGDGERVAEGTSVFLWESQIQNHRKTINMRIASTPTTSATAIEFPTTSLDLDRNWCFELSAAIVAERKATDRAGVGILREGPMASSNLSQMFYSICRKTVSIYVIFQIRDAILNPMLEMILMR